VTSVRSARAERTLVPTLPVAPVTTIRMRSGYPAVLGGNRVAN
jgi:hypothetical protein